jgi:hypothetical protein
MLASAAVAQEAGRAEGADASGASGGSGQLGADQWVPSLSAVAGLTIGNWKGETASLYCQGCTIPSVDMTPLRDPVSGDARDVTPYVGGSLELMTPELPIPTWPRLFVGGEVAATFGFMRNLAPEGEPGELRSPAPAGNENVPYEEDKALGQGSALEAQLQSPFYGAYVGISFPLELYGRQLRIKPSFGWLHYDIEVAGLLVDAECARSTMGATNCNDLATPPGFMRQIRLEASQTTSFDAIGPGLDIELDTGLLGPLGTSLFGGMRFYRNLGNLSLHLQDGASYDDRVGGVDQAAVQWDFEIEPWTYRIVLGMRFQWLGSQK